MVRQTMLQDEFVSVYRAETRAELLKRIVCFTRRLGFQTVSATTIVDHSHADSEFFILDNTPLAYRSEYADLENCRRDPVAQHCKHHSIPIVWNRATYISTGQGSKWEIQARYGYSCGIALAMHLSEGIHFLLGVDRDQALPTNAAEINRMAADLQLFAVHAQDAAQRLLLPARTPADLPALTPRELECLRWTMEGKTAWELGRILGISEHTAIRHINTATHKMGSVNKHQAVLRALRLKLIG